MQLERDNDWATPMTFTEYAATRGWRVITEHLPYEDGIIEVRTLTKTVDNYAWWMSLPKTDPPPSEWEFRVDFGEKALEAERNQYIATQAGKQLSDDDEIVFDCTGDEGAW